MQPCAQAAPLVGSIVPSEGVICCSLACCFKDLRSAIEQYDEIINRATAMGKDAPRHYLRDEREAAYQRLANAIKRHLGNCYFELRYRPSLVRKADRMQRNKPCKQYQPSVVPDVAVNRPMKRLFEDLVNIWHRHDTLVEDRAANDDGRFEAAQQQIFADAAARINAHGD